MGYVVQLREAHVPAMRREFQITVPAIGRRGPQPVWRAGTVLKQCLGLSRPERVRIWETGGVTINGIPAAAFNVHCFPGDSVVAWYPEPESTVTPEDDVPLAVLYADEWLLAVDKPAGRLAHPARREQHGTIANAVAARFSDGGQPEPVRLIHRLDRDTSGVLLFARTAEVARHLARMRSAGSLDRVYLALVAGCPPVRGEITFSLASDPSHRTRRVCVALDGEAVQFQAFTGKVEQAHTSYRVVSYGPSATLVAVWLHTGRTHQIRAHFAGTGHPVLGDALYGGSSVPGLARQALHAWRTRLRHPVTGATLEIIAPLPDDFRAAALAIRYP